MWTLMEGGNRTAVDLLSLFRAQKLLNSFFFERIQELHLLQNNKKNNIKRQKCCESQCMIRVFIFI